MTLQDQLVEHLMEERDVFGGVLHGAVYFARRLLAAAGAKDLDLTRVLCTPDGRTWRLAFSGHLFEVNIADDGFAVRCLDIPPCEPLPAGRAR